jgi:response regulator RpfG family c-di-GMP phosphodiesterase
LAENNFYVISAPDGKEGVQKALGEKPDIIIWDISMLWKSGCKLLRELQDNNNTKNTPIIITGATSGFKRFIGACKQVHISESYYKKLTEQIRSFKEGERIIKILNLITILLLDLYTIIN